MILNVYSLNPLLRSIQMIPLIQLIINAATSMGKDVDSSQLQPTILMIIRDATDLNSTATNPAEKLKRIFLWNQIEKLEN